MEGTQTTGLAAHDWFRHPGPAYCYLQAPLYWMSGCSARSLYLSAALINVAAIMTTLLVVRRLAGAGPLLLWAVLLTLFINFVGAYFWVSFRGTHGQLMPFVLAVVLLAAVGTGRWHYLPAALAVASLPVQHYVAYFPALAGVGAAALALGGSPRLRRRLGIESAILFTRENDRSPKRKRGSKAVSSRALRASMLRPKCFIFAREQYNRGSPRRAVVLSLLVLAATWAPPLLGRFPRPPEHLVELVRFFASHGASHGWTETARLLIGQLSALPAYCLSGQRDWQWSGPNRAVLCGLAAIQFLLVAASYWAARKVAFQRVLCLFAVVLVAACGFSIRHAYGPVSHHQIYWMSAFSLLVFAAAGGVLLSRLGMPAQPSPPAPLPEGEGSKLPSPPAPLPAGEGSKLPSPPAPLPEGEGSKLPSPPAPLPAGEGSKLPSPPAPLPEGEGSKLPSPPAPLPAGEGSKLPSPPAPLREGARGVMPCILGRFWKILSYRGRGRVARAVAFALVACGSALNVYDACRQPARLASEEYDAACDPRPLLAACRATFEAGGVHRCLVRIVDHDAWPTAAYLVTALTKAGTHVAVEPSWRMAFGRQHDQGQDADGTLLVCNLSGGKRLSRDGRLRILGQTADAMLFWEKN